MESVSDSTFSDDTARDWSPKAGAVKDLPPVAEAEELGKQAGGQGGSWGVMDMSAGSAHMVRAAVLWATVVPSGRAMTGCLVIGK